MSKWKHVSEERKKQLFAFNKSRAEDAEKAQDFIVLLNAMPKGIVKQLFKDDDCAAILGKYGITEE